MSGQDLTALTPMLRQYHAVKQEVPDALLLFRLGDFYELFFEDAVTASRELEITLTARHKDSDQPADTVIAQSPKPGTGAANDAEVTLDVSKGPPLVTIQDVNNQQCQQAQAALQAQGLQVQITGFNPQGFVRGMNPPANTQVPPQTQVILQCF